MQQVCLCEPFSSSEIMVCHTIHEEQLSTGAFLLLYLVLEVSEEHLSFTCMKKGKFFLPLPGNEVICLRRKIISCVVLQSLA